MSIKKRLGAILASGLLLTVTSFMLSNGVVDVMGGHN